MTDVGVEIARQPVTDRALRKLMDTPQIPNRYKTMSQLIATIWSGREMGILPMTAIREMHTINGQVGLSAKMQHALIHRAGHVLVVEEMTNEKATVNAMRRDPYTHELMPVGSFSYTWDDAIKAGNDMSDTYQSFPSDMLMNRAITRAAKFAFSDVMAGFYLPEELGEDPQFEHVDLTDMDEAVALLEDTLDADVVEVIDAEESAEGETDESTEG